MRRVMLMLALAIWVFTAGSAHAQGSAKPSAVVDMWPDAKMPGKGATEPEADLPLRPPLVIRLSSAQGALK